MQQESKNYYEVLEIPTSATQEEVHKAYLRAKNAYSGDSIALYSLMSSSDCDSILQQIEEAYMVLSVPDKRRDYDKYKGFNRNTATIEDRSTFYEPQKRVEDLQQPMNNMAAAMASTGMPSSHYGGPVPENHQASGNFSHTGITTFNPNRLNDDEHSRDFSINRNQVAESSKLSAVKRFSLNYERNAEFEQQVENATDYTGEFLQKIREYKQVDIPRMSDMTKISKTYIRNIEADDWGNLPAPAYTRGFVYQYAKCLKLNPDLVATSYMHHLKNLKNTKNSA